MPSHLTLRRGPVPRPPVGTGKEKVFIDAADGHVKSINYAGDITDLESGTGGAVAVTDGETTVNPASTLTFPKGSVVDSGDGVAGVTPPPVVGGLGGNIGQGFSPAATFIIDLFRYGFMGFLGGACIAAPMVESGSNVSVLSAVSLYLPDFISPVGWEAHLVIRISDAAGTNTLVLDGPIVAQQTLGQHDSHNYVLDLTDFAPVIVGTDLHIDGTDTILSTAGIHYNVSLGVIILTGGPS